MPPLGRHTGRNGERGEDVSDFEQVYRENADIVYRYLFSLSYDRDLSEDLTQQTFCEALRHSGKYRGESAISTYLCGIAKNLLRREWARQARRRHVPLEEAEDLPAPESAHAIRAAMDEALKCKETGEAKTIVFGLTGTGYFDMVAYEKFHDGKMDNYIPTDAELEASLAKLPRVE